MTLIAFLFAILLLVGFHEYGHYLAAKFCGIAVERFSIGFGPVIFKSEPKKAFDTEFVLSAIPLGGYIKMLDSRGGDVLSTEQKKKAFDHQVLWKRSLVVLAGPLANFLLAWALLTCLYLTNPPQVRSILDKPDANSIAGILGIVEGDEVRGFATLESGASEQILHFDSIPSWNRFRWKVLKSVFQKKGFVLEIDHESKGLYRVQFSKEEISKVNLQGDLFKQLGLNLTKTDPDALFKLDADLPTAFSLAAERVYDISVVSLLSIKSLIAGDASIGQIMGPIGISTMAGKSAQSGVVAYIGFLALISISLGLMNLLPLPMLDGGQLVFDIWEFLTGKAVSEDFRSFTTKLGLLGIVLISCIAFFNDFSRLFNG